MFEFIHHVWSEKYRPKTIDECILPKNTKATLKGFLSKEILPNLLLHGTAGVGKCLDGDEKIDVRINTEKLSDTQKKLLEQYIK